MDVVNAIVPVAGLGTRLLPSTKSQPKEMLPVGRKPVVQYVFEELERSGLTRVLFVTGRGKHAIEDHFDRDAELRRLLSTDPGKRDLLETLDFENHHVQIYYVRQSRQRGLGDAVLHGRAFAEGRPFVVALGDSLITQERPAPPIVSRLISCFRERKATCVIAFQEVPPEDVSRYGIAAPKGGGEVFEVSDLVEKPKVGEAPSLQLTDAIRTLLHERGGVYGVRLAPDEKRYDIGNMGSYFRSFVTLALRDPEYGPALREYLRGLL